MSELELRYKLWPRQKEALLSQATEILFGGASEGGKSHFLRVALISACLGIPGLQAALIRKKYSDILDNHVEGPTGFRALLAPLIANKTVNLTKERIEFSHGSTLVFIHCQDERQFETAQGTERHFLAIDEATQISERLLRYFRAWCRMPAEFKAGLPEELRDKFPRIVYTANPIGPSVPYFRRHFVKARATMAIEDVHGFKRQYIPSRAADNLSISLQEHQARLDGLGDAALARALDVGDWDAPIGEYFPQYDEERHVTPDFEPPAGWFKFLTFDWGGSDPFAVLWLCVSDGQEFTDARGRKRWFRRGALIVYREWYGAQVDNPAKGLEMRNEDIAAGIIQRTLEPTSGLVLTDSLPFQDRGMSKNGKKWRIADVFRDAGCPLVRANTARVTGWAQVRDRLIGIDGDPLLLFVESARYCREYVPALPRHDAKPEDAAEHGEATHICDCLRYAATARPLVKDEIAAIPEKSDAPTIKPAELLKRLKYGRSYHHAYN